MQSSVLSSLIYRLRILCGWYKLALGQKNEFHIHTSSSSFIGASFPYNRRLFTSAIELFDIFGVQSLLCQANSPLCTEAYHEGLLEFLVKGKDMK